MAAAASPFVRMLVPYDGSEPAQAALNVAIALAQHGMELVITTVVDETPLMGDAGGTMVAYDPTPIMDALDAEGTSLLDAAVERCRAGGIVPVTETVHDKPVAGILASGDKHGCDIVIIGTHARSGVARTFLGSTTEGILRLSRVPVLTVRTVDRLETSPFAKVLLAIDDSEPADAAAAVAARLVRGAGAVVTAAFVVDSIHLYENAAGFDVDPEPLVSEMRDGGRILVHAALARAGLAGDTAVSILDGEPVAALVAEAQERHATLIVTGTHGRRGVRRFLLGSVAEHLVRSSEVPVLVVPVP